MKINDDVKNINVNYNIKSYNDNFLHVGVLGYLIDVICYLIGSKKEKREREYFKKITYDPEAGVYFDQYGTRRSIIDNSYVQVNRNVFGEIEVRYQNGTMRNLTQEEYDKIPGTVTRLAGYSRFERSHYYKTAVGYRYKDRKNGKIYCIRRLKYKDGESFRFYMDVKNGLLIRPTDGQYRLEMMAKKANKKYYTNEDFKEMIEYFNNNIDHYNKATFFRNDDYDKDLDAELIKIFIKYRKGLV